MNYPTKYYNFVNFESAGLGYIGEITVIRTFISDIFTDRTHVELIYVK